MEDIIRHTGTVESIEGSHIRVRIVQTSACASCAAHQYCNSSESKEKIVDVTDRQAAATCRVGQQVEVVGSTSMGMKAVFLAFGAPFLVLVAVLYAAIRLTGGDEVVSALASLASLATYYLILYMYREKLRKKFTFKLKTNLNN